VIGNMEILKPLNLPPFDPKIRKGKDDKLSIFDPLRNKYVALTPEEWVRQHFIHFLIEHRGYPQTLLANEIAITLNGTTKRCDTVLYDIHMSPQMIVEYKAPNIPITQKVFDQITRYNMVLHVEYLIVSNGMNHYCCKIDLKENRYTFLQDIPAYENL
jgi:hypothetical protein